MRISDWSSDVGSSELTECGQDIGAKKREPAEEQAEVVADGGEDGIDGIAGGMGEVIAIHPVVGFEMTDDGLDGGSSFELALDGLGDARSEARRGGKGVVSTGKSGGEPYNLKKK